MTIYYLCPSFDSHTPSGGQRRLYHHVDILNENGIDARIVHNRKNHRLEWFSNSTPIEYTPLAVTSADILVVPEVLASRLEALCPGIPKILIDLNVFNSIDLLERGTFDSNWSADLLAVLCNSEYSHRFWSILDLGLPVRRITHGFDASIWYPEPDQKPLRQITFMPRRRQKDAARVFALLRRRGLLGGWQVKQIEGSPEIEVAKLLRESALFLSFGFREGWGRPPAEAVACGAHVIGYSGIGGEEIFRYPTTRSIEDGDILRFAEAVQEWIQEFESDETGFKVRAIKSAADIRNRYSSQLEAAELVAAFNDVEPKPVDQKELQQSELVFKHLSLRGVTRMREHGRQLVNRVIPVAVKKQIKDRAENDSPGSSPRS